MGDSVYKDITKRPTSGKKKRLNTNYYEIRFDLRN